jgi:Amt family ammonium transporter
MNVLLKNLCDGMVGAIAWWATGFAFAFGNVQGGFLGKKYFVGIGLEADDQYGNWFFQYTFASTAATIVSGSVAERVHFLTYILYSFFTTAWTYPVVVAWTWGSGWLYERGF